MRPLPLAAAGTSARLWFYPPRLRQAAHSHERAHVSILIGGSIREVCGGRDEIGVGSQLRLRPYEIRHEVEFGPEGALILAVEVEHLVARTTASSWIHRDLSVAQRVLLKWVLTERCCGWRGRWRLHPGSRCEHRNGIAARLAARVADAGARTFDGRSCERAHRFAGTRGRRTSRALRSRLPALVPDFAELVPAPRDVDACDCRHRLGPEAGPGCAYRRLR
jgi:hypothetical protein